MSTAMLAACVLAAGLGVARGIPQNVDANLTWSPFQDGEIGGNLTFWTPIAFDRRQTQYYYVLEDLTAIDGRQIVGAQQRLDEHARKYVHHMVLSICFGRPPSSLSFGEPYGLNSKAWIGAQGKWKERQCQNMVYNDANSRTTFPDVGIVVGAGSSKLAGGFVINNVHISPKHISKLQGLTSLEHVGWTLYHVPAATRSGMLWHSTSFSGSKSLRVPAHQMSYNRGLCQVWMTGAGDNWAMLKSMRVHAHSRLHSWHAAVMRGKGNWHPLVNDNTGPGPTFGEYLRPSGEGDDHLEPRLRVGDIIQWVCAFNNTEDRLIKGGHGTDGEMCGVFMNNVCISACEAFRFECKTLTSEMFTPAPGTPVYALATPWPQGWTFVKKVQARHTKHTSQR